MRRKVIMLVTTVVLVVAWFTATVLGDARPQLGLDLQGGISIVLFPVEGSDLSTLDTAVQIIQNRVNALGVAEPEVSRQGNTIVVDLAGVKNRDEAERLVGRTAELQFRVVKEGTQPVPATATVEATTTTTAGAATTTTAAEGSTTTTAAGATTTTAAAATTTTAASTETSKGAAGATISTQPIAAVRPAETGTSVTAAAGEATATTVGAVVSAAGDATTTTAAGGSATTAAGGSTTTAAGGSTTTAPPVSTTSLPVGTRYCDALVGESKDPAADGAWVWGKDEKFCYQLDSLANSGGLTGESVRTARYEYGLDRCSGATSPHCVTVTFRGNDFVEKVATPFVNREMAIVLDDIVQSAPTINPGITGKDIVITGDFTEAEAKDLALVLRYGSLPIKFDENQQTVTSVSPSLGKDQLRAGIVAGLIGLALVALYMIFFYRLLGLVVWVGLALTGMIFFSLVTFLGQQQGLTLTLSGVTGIIVSVGVTVDSYVVYFERLKDEVRQGKTIRSSLDTGFRKAFRTILAADLVSLIGAGVLYLLAIGSVRGFAYFLALSTLIDLLIAYFVMYPLVSIMARNPKLVQMRGVGIAAGLDVAREAAV